MKRIILNIDKDYSEQFDVLECEYEKLLLISIYCPCIKINLVREITKRTSKGILEIIYWIEKIYYNEDKIYKYLINSLRGE